MIIDCRDWKTQEDRDKYARRVFVDGVEIHKIWYVDTEQGFVNTYDLRDGEGPRLSRDVSRADYPADWEIYTFPDDIVYRTIRGKVELKPL